jgi:hypothetical protein
MLLVDCDRACRPDLGFCQPGLANQALGDHNDHFPPFATIFTGEKFNLRYASIKPLVMPRNGRMNSQAGGLGQHRELRVPD